MPDGTRADTEQKDRVAARFKLDAEDRLTSNHAGWR